MHVCHELNILEGRIHFGCTIPRLQVSEAADAGDALVLEKLEMGLANATASVLTRLGNAAAILEMGPANALRASFAQAGPKEVASAAHSAETSSTTDCVRQARPKEVVGIRLHTRFSLCV
jgi:hypothetical protein